MDGLKIKDDKDKFAACEIKALETKIKCEKYAGFVKNWFRLDE